MSRLLTNQSAACRKAPVSRPERNGLQPTNKIHELVLENSGQGADIASLSRESISYHASQFASGTMPAHQEVDPLRRQLLDMHKDWGLIPQTIRDACKALSDQERGEHLLAGRTATQLNCLSEVEFNRALDRPRPLGCVGLGDPEDSLTAINKCFDETLADLRLSIREDLGAQPHLASEHALLSVTEEAIERTDAPYLRVRQTKEALRADINRHSALLQGAAHLRTYVPGANLNAVHPDRLRSGDTLTTYPSLRNLYNSAYAGEVAALVVAAEHHDDSRLETNPLTGIRLTRLIPFKERAGISRRHDLCWA